MRRTELASRSARPCLSAPPPSAHAALPPMPELLASQLSSTPVLQLPFAEDCRPAGGLRVPRVSPSLSLVEGAAKNDTEWWNTTLRGTIALGRTTLMVSGPTSAGSAAPPAPGFPDGVLGSAPVE